MTTSQVVSMRYFCSRSSFAVHLYIYVRWWQQPTRLPPHRDSGLSPGGGADAGSAHTADIKVGQTNPRYDL